MSYESRHNSKLLNLEKKYFLCEAELGNSNYHISWLKIFVKALWNEIKDIHEELRVIFL
jgi:hypothetical protein